MLFHWSPQAVALYQCSASWTMPNLSTSVEFGHLFLPRYHMSRAIWVKHRKIGQTLSGQTHPSAVVTSVPAQKFSRVVWLPKFLTLFKNLAYSGFKRQGLQIYLFAYIKEWFLISVWLDFTILTHDPRKSLAFNLKWLPTLSLVLSGRLWETDSMLFSSIAICNMTTTALTYNVVWWKTDTHPARIQTVLYSDL